MKQKLLWIAAFFLIFSAAGCTAAPGEGPPPVPGSAVSSVLDRDELADAEASPVLGGDEQTYTEASPIPDGDEQTDTDEAPVADGSDHQLLSLLVSQTNALTISAGDARIYGIMCYERPFFMLTKGTIQSLGLDQEDIPVQALEEINRFFQTECEAFFQNKNAQRFQDDASAYTVWCEDDGASLFSERLNKMTTQAVYCDGSIISFRQVHEWFLGGLHEYHDAGKVFSLETGEPLPLSHFLELEFENFQNVILGFLIDQAGGIALIPQTPQEAADIYGYSGFSDYDYYYMDGELYIILPISSITALLTSATDMIVRWPVGAAEPAELLWGTEPEPG